VDVKAPGARKVVADRLMRAMYAFMRASGRTRRAFVMPVPTTVPGGYISIMTSPLLNGRGEEVGEVRIWIYVPDNAALSIRVRFEWTRKAFGFWYRNEVYIQNVDDPRIELLKVARDALFFVKITADGTVRVASMNRGGFQKIRKSKTRDRAARVGMMMG
jgi:hypothetical protein